MATEAPTEPRTSTEEGRAVLERAVDRFNAGDYDAYFSCFTDDLESFSGVVTPLRWSGLSGWKSLIDGLSRLASASYEQRDLTLRAYNGDTVVANAYFVFTTITEAGEVERQTGRASHTCVHTDDGWRIVNQHYSPVF